MKYYVQFLDTDVPGHIVEAMGSDGVFILDGRNSMDTMTVDAITQFHRMNKNIHTYVGWRIMKGSRFDNSKMIKEWIRAGQSTC